MQILPVDLTAIVALVMGISIILIPVAGLTARFALKPTVEALAKVFEQRGVGESVGILEQRMNLLESQLESMNRSLDRIAAVVEFDHELERKQGVGSLDDGGAGGETASARRLDAGAPGR